MSDYFPYIAAAIGALVALSGLRSLIAARRFEARAERATAEVTDVQVEWVSGSRGQNRVRTPVVRFTTADGRAVHGQTTPYRGFKTPEAGDALEVLYDPADPADIRLPMGVAGLGSIVSAALFVVIVLVVFA